MSSPRIPEETLQQGQRVPVETAVQEPQVYDIEPTGKTHLEAPLTAQEEMTRQISRLWELHANFRGLSDHDSQSETSSISDSNNKDGATEGEAAAAAADMDAYAVRAKVHEQLLLAQSEIQVSLDMVRLLVAAKKRATRDAVAAALKSTSLVKHDQQQAPGVLPNLVDSDVPDEVTVGGLPFPVGILDTIRTDASHISGDAAQRREDELKLVLGAKYRQLDAAANTLQASSQRLKRVAAREAVFWRTAFELRRRNWMVQQQQQLTGHQLRGYADRFFVRYGYADAGSSFAEDSLAELLRDTASDDATDSASPDAMDVVGQSPSPAAATSAAPLYIQRSDLRSIQVRLNATYSQPHSVVGSTLSNEGFADNGEFVDAKDSNAFDQAHHRLLRARRASFDRELYHRLCREARILELGSIRSSASVHDMLVATLSRDDVAVRFEWILDDNSTSGSEGNMSERKPSFVEWQCGYYARLALVMAAMHQRRMHRAVKGYYLGHGRGIRGSSHPPDAFVAVHAAASGTSPAATAPGGLSDEHAGSLSKATGGPGASGTAPATPATPGTSISEPAAASATAMAPGSSAAMSTTPAAGSGGATFAVARPDLLILAPVLQSVQFAKWQHILSATIQRACAAWQRLVEEPIEVVGHFSPIYRTPDSATDRHEWEDFCATGRHIPGSVASAAGPADSLCQGLCYAVRMRFLGGTVMVFRVDSEGSLIFAKGYFPPLVPVAKPTDRTTAEPGGSVLWSQPEQMFIHRVFRIIPLSGMADFVDQLRRELQSLVLLRVAAALSRRNYHGLRTDRRCQMGPWFVHQSQLCVLGEWWEGARNRQIVGVAKWGAQQTVSSARGLGDSSEDWDLRLFFGPKHPTAFDAVAGSRLAGTIIPWITSYPPPDPKHADSTDSSHQLSNGGGKSFEQRLFATLVAAF